MAYARALNTQEGLLATIGQGYGPEKSFGNENRSQAQNMRKTNPHGGDSHAKVLIAIVLTFASVLSSLSG